MRPLLALLLLAACPSVEEEQPPIVEPQGPPFERWTDRAGVDVPEGLGVSAGDVNGDGWPDLFLPALLGTGGEFGHRLFLNRGDGSFDDASADWLPRTTRHGAWGATLADLDGDGDLDIALAGTGPNRLWRNDGDGFVELVSTTVDGDPQASGASIAAADWDGDGRLDLYVVNHEFQGQSGGGVPHPPDLLLRNLGDFAFEDVSALLPEARRAGAGFAAAWTDLDEDGDVDLYVVNDFGRDVPNQYFRNDGGSFLPADAICACGLAVDGMGVATADYDGDERVDLYLSDRHGERLLRNLGGLTVETTATDGGLGDSTDASRGTSWTPEFLDFDRDGWPDLVLAFGDEFAHDPADNRLLRNVGGSFEEVEDSGFEDPRDTRGLALIDVDRDGCTDLALRGPTGFELYRGRCPDRGWIGLELEGLAAGARVEVMAGRRQVHEVGVGSTSVHGSRDPSLRFGLGDAALEEVLVRWPEGAIDRWTDLEPGAYHALERGGGDR